MVKRLFMLVPALAALAVLAGCGSGNSSSSTKAAAAPAGSSTPATTGGATSTPAASEGATKSEGATPAVVTTKHAKLGTILAAGAKHLTVYLFEADANGKSTCSGACEAVWPPVTTSSSPRASGAAVSADLGTIMRANGTKQVTYKGHPLYFFAKDKDNGDAYGQDSQAFGAGWYVMAPSGAKVEQHKGGGGAS